MTIDEAIKHCEEVAEKQELSADDKEMYSEMLGEDYKGFEEGCCECASDHRQLAKWLAEFKEVKRLLKAAVEDLNSINRVLKDDDILCMKYTACKGCPFNGENCNKWRCDGEAIALIGDESDGI